MGTDARPDEELHEILPSTTEKYADISEKVEWFSQCH